MSGHVALVVPSPQLCEPLIQNLAEDGYCALTFHSVEETMLFLRAPGCPADVVAFSLTMRRQSDNAALIELCAERPELKVLFIREEESSALEMAFAEGLSPEVVHRPLHHPDVEAALRRLLQLSSRANGRLPGVFRAQALPQLPYSEEFLRRVAGADVPVLLIGETGVGKEVMARRLQSYSGRSEMPFLKINCAALPPELAESELFGSAKGAFTGATADRQGRFEMAQGGTILLDEIGDMDLRLQTKLLHVLQDGEIQPLGSNRTIRVNVRMMAATHRDLARAVQEGTFREDLYYRLNVIRLVIPPLRERVEEILPLAQQLLLRHTAAGQKAPAMSDELKRYLVSYRWPGNVRELENVIRRFLVYQDSTLILNELLENGNEHRPALTNVTSFPDGTSRGGRGAAFEAGSGRPEGLESRDASSRDLLAEASRVAETELILGALEANRWNRRLAAASLQIEYKAFLYKMQKYGIVSAKRKRGEISA